MKQLDGLCIAGVEIKWCSHCGKMVWWFLKLNTDLPYDPAIPLQDTCPREVAVGTRRGVCTRMFTAALFTVAETWKQPKHPWQMMDNQNVVYTYNGMLFSHERKEILTHAVTRMNFEDMLRKKSQSQKNKYCIFYISSWSCQTQRDRK